MIRVYTVSSGERDILRHYKEIALPTASQGDVGAEKRDTLGSTTRHSQLSRQAAADRGFGVHRSRRRDHRRRHHWRAFQRLAGRGDSRRRALDSHRRAHQYSGWFGAARDAGRVSADARRRRHRRPRRDSARLHHRVALPDRHGRDPAEWRAIGAGWIVAAGTLVPERTVFRRAACSWATGKIAARLTADDQASIDAYAARYVEYKKIYREEPTE